MAAVEEIGEVSKTDESSPLLKRLPSAVVSLAFGFCSLQEHLQLSRVSQRTKQITELKLSAPAKIELGSSPSAESTEISRAMLNKIRWTKIFHASPSNRVLQNHLGVVGFFSSSTSSANFQWEELSLNFETNLLIPVGFKRNEQISLAYKWLTAFAEMQPTSRLHTLKLYYPYYFHFRHTIIWAKALKSFPSLTSLSASSFNFTKLELVRQLPSTVTELVVDWTGEMPSSEVCAVLSKLPLRKLSLDVRHSDILTDSTSVPRQWERGPQLLKLLAPHLSKLEELRMIGCRINHNVGNDNKDGNGMEWFVPQFKSLTHLTMGGVDTAFLTDHFLPTNGAQLKKLELHHRPINEISNLSDNSDLSISEMLLQCTQLEHLALVNYGLSNLEMAFIISESDKHPSILHTLDLRENDIELTDVFSPLSNSLTSLFLSHRSSPSSPSAKSTMDTVRTFPHLPALRNLQTSYLCGQLEKLFSGSQFWQHFPNLESWDFSNSNIFFQVAKSTTSSTTSSSSLLKLNFQLCSFFPDYVGQVLQDHPQLRLLHLPRGNPTIGSSLDCHYPVPPDALLLAESRGLQLTY